MNLIEGIQKECERLRGWVKEYEAIGQAGVLGATFLRADIAAEQPSLRATSGDGNGLQISARTESF